MNVNTELYLGDFFESCDNIKDESVDLILTDPPYDLLGSIGHKWDQYIDLSILEQVYSRLLKPNGQVITFCNFRLMRELLNTWREEMEFRGFHIWHKTSAMPGNKYHPLPDCEHILVFKKKGSQYSDLCFNPYGAIKEGEPYKKINHIRDVPTRRQKKSLVSENSFGGRYIRTVLTAPNKPHMKKDERTSHPTQKPIELLSQLVRVYSNRDDLILDPFAGSASTLIASMDEERRSIGFELMPEYFEEAKSRLINKALNQLLIDDRGSSIILWDEIPRNTLLAPN